MGYQHVNVANGNPLFATRRVKLTSITGISAGRPSWLAIDTSNPSGNYCRVGIASPPAIDLRPLFAGFPIIRPNQNYKVGDWVDLVIPVKGAVTRVYAGSGDVGNPVYFSNSGILLGSGSGDPPAILLEEPTADNNFSPLAVLTGA